MAITNGYATLAQVKAYLRITSVDAGDDAVIEDLVEKASRLIDATSGRQFYASTATRYFTATCGDYLDLKMDLLSITTLKTDADGDRTYETTWATTDYDLMPFNYTPYQWLEITPMGANYFPTLSKGVEIVGSWGYSSTTPEDVELACLIMVENAYRERFQEVVMVDSAASLLKRYRKMT
jgi:hypothetical protein